MALSRKLFPLIALIILLFTHQAHTMDLTLFGPEKFIRTAGEPNIHTFTLSGSLPEGKLIVRNGEEEERHRVTSAFIYVNDTQVLGSSDFKQHIHLLAVPIRLQENNSIRLELYGEPGTYLTLEIVTTEPPPPVSELPVVEFTAIPSVVSKGQTAVLSWISRNTQSAHIDNRIGMVPVAGSVAVSPSCTTTYTLTVTGPEGSAGAAARVMVTGNPEPPPEGSFADTYRDLVPADATIESYDPRRFSVITGLVYGFDGSPLSDVSVSIHGRPGYGTAFTDEEGRFSLPMDGGATFNITYHKEGWLTAQRKVYVPWNDIAIAERIVMIPQDPVATAVIFDGNPDAAITHRSSELTDEFGSRSCSMVFTGDNRAYLTDENGSDVHELTTLKARATVYATPASMPAVLPPNSAFTYCVELAADGVQRVRFAKPVIVWVENYLGFEVGEIVPSGYYDRDRGVWVPSENGIVVRLLDTDHDGVTDALDANGDGLPDDLNGDESVSDEVQGLSDPQRYPPGATFWRVAVTHFTPWDFNWPYGPPQDAAAPNPQGVPDADQPGEVQPQDIQCVNSYVNQRSRVYHEDIPIPGTDITLHYASNRTKGYKTTIRVPASGNSVPASLEEIIVKVEVAGKTLEQRLAPLPDQVVEFVWDGLDFRGEKVQGTATAFIDVGFVYSAFYYSADQVFSQAFASAGTNFTGIRAQQKVVSWNKSKIKVHGTDYRIQSPIAEGWTFSIHHHISTSDLSVLVKGNGSISTSNISFIKTSAGSGASGYGGDGGPASAARLRSPRGIAVDGAGNLYIADSGNHLIRKVDMEGIITTAAGNGARGFSGDGGPAVMAQLNLPTDIAVDASGNIYIADYSNYRIRKVDTSGIISTVAGNGSLDVGGDGGPATQVAINPTNLAVDIWGNLYFSEEYVHRVRKVGADGIMTNVAGSGIRGFDGDGGPANLAKLSWPGSVAVDSFGNLFIGETGNYCIRKVDAAGIITTVAGNRLRGFSGDDGPALLAKMQGPAGLTLDRTGNLYISDPWNRRIRRVDNSGFIVTIAGNGTYGTGGDGGAAVHAELTYPSGIAFDASGKLYLADRDSARIRVIDNGNFSTLLSESELLFAEEGDIGHIMTRCGLHRRTIDLITGAVLWSFEYDEGNNLVSMYDRFDNKTRIERDSQSTVVAVISPDGIRTDLSVAGLHLDTVNYPDGNAFRLEYLPEGLMTTKTDPGGNRFESVFDANGKLSAVSDEEGGLWQYTKAYDANGDIMVENLTAEGNFTLFRDRTDSTGAYTTTITDSTGAETFHRRSADGITVEESLSCGSNVSFQYGVDTRFKYPYVKQTAETTPSGLQRKTLRQKTYQDTDGDEIPDLITEFVTVNGKESVLTQDVLQTKKSVTSPEGRLVTSFYDPSTLVTEKVSTPGLFDTSYVYDPRGRLTNSYTLDRETSFTYNDQGFLNSATDPEGYTTSFTYDPMGRPTAVYRPDGSSVGFSYDPNGNRTAVINPADIGHAFGYNRINYNTSYLAPISGRYEYFYDRDRRLVKSKSPSGLQIENIYDQNKLLQVRTPEGDIDFSYLCGTKIGSLTKGAESIGYDYDGEMVTSESLSGTLNQSLSYTYDNDFNLESFTYAGQTTYFSYDDDGLLTGSGPFAVTRNAGNGLPEALSGGTFSLSRTFNGYGEVETQSSRVGGDSLSSWALGRDRTGRIIAKSEVVNGIAAHFVYTYDAAGRLETVTKDGASVETYAYDITGTRTFERNTSRDIAGRNFSYSDEDHLLSAGDTTYRYDVDGFLTSKTKGSEVTAYNYSSRGELLKVTLPDGRIIEHIHDPLGRRIAKKVNGIIVEKYLWYGLTRLLAVYDGAGAQKMRFEYADDRMPISASIGGVIYYLVYDQVGSLRLIVNASGNVVKEVQYDSFGNVIFDSQPAFRIPFGFAGGLYDKETGFLRFGYRDYDPDTGRWTAKDPIFFAGGDTDLYGYASNNPINFLDPNGLALSDILPGIQTALLRGAQGGVRALDQTANNIFAIAKNGHPLAQVALGMALLGEAAPLSGAAAISSFSAVTYAAYKAAPYSGVIGDFIYGFFIETGPPKGWGYLSSGVLTLYDAIKKIVSDQTTSPCEK